MVAWNLDHLLFVLQFKLMTSWALVADIYFLPPQTQGKDETSEGFAKRVQKMIADVAKLRICDWDGYLKYYNLAQKVRLQFTPLGCCFAHDFCYQERLSGWLHTA